MDRPAVGEYVTVDGYTVDYNGYVDRNIAVTITVGEDDWFNYATLKPVFLCGANLVRNRININLYIVLQALLI